MPSVTWAYEVNKLVSDNTPVGLMKPEPVPMGIVVVLAKIGWCFLPW